MDFMSSPGPGRTFAASSTRVGFHDGSPGRVSDFVPTARPAGNRPRGLVHPFWFRPRGLGISRFAATLGHPRSMPVTASDILAPPMNRRDFLQYTALAAAGPMLAEP